MPSRKQGPMMVPYVQTDIAIRCVTWTLPQALLCTLIKFNSKAPACSARDGGRVACLKKLRI